MGEGGGGTSITSNDMKNLVKYAYISIINCCTYLKYFQHFPVFFVVFLLCIFFIFPKRILASASIFAFNQQQQTATQSTCTTFISARSASLSLTHPLPLSPTVCSRYNIVQDVGKMKLIFCIAAYRNLNKCGYKKCPWPTPESLSSSAERGRGGGRRRRSRQGKRERGRTRERRLGTTATPFGGQFVES